MFPLLDRNQHLRRRPGKVSGSENLMRFDNIKQVMPNAAAFFQPELARADVETAVHLDRIKIQDLAVQVFGESKCQCRLSRCRRTDDRNKSCVLVVLPNRGLPAQRAHHSRRR